MPTCAGYPKLGNDLELVHYLAACRKTAAQKVRFRRKTWRQDRSVGRMHTEPPYQPVVKIGRQLFLTDSAPQAIVQVDCSGAETSRLKEFEIPS